MLSTIVFILSAVSVVQIGGVSASYWEHTIHVNTSGTNNATCWNGNVPCDNLNLALQGIILNSTVIYIYDGCYNLHNATENIVHKKSDIAIIGLGESVIIECENKAGLSFVRSRNITLQNLTLHGCGSVQSSTSRNVHHPNLTYINFTVAIYMLKCSNVSVDSVAILHSIGVGMTMYSVMNVTISHSRFDSNALDNTNDTEGGGGGLQIEFTDCFPSFFKCVPFDKDDPVFSSKAWFVIEHTIFKNNTSSRMSHYLPYKLPNENKRYYSFGRGGGVAIVVRGLTENKNISLNNVTIVSNSAHFGGGFFISFHNKTKCNTVTIEKSNISDNSNFGHEHGPRTLSYSNSDGGGGGGKVVFSVAHKQVCSKLNNVTIADCTFDNNTGYVGGGFSIEAIFTHQTETLNNTLCIRDSHFIRNTAFLGSGLYFSCSSSSEATPFLTTNISNITVNWSKSMCDSLDKSSATLPCSGTFYTNNYPLTLQSTIHIINNSASGLEVHSSELTIDKNAEIYFENNHGDQGGAIGLYDCSVITLRENVILNFTNNRARIHGGAIYSNKCTLNNQPTTLSSECFLQYFNQSPNAHPWNWNVSLNFENNTIDDGDNGLKPNSIYAYDVIPCWELQLHETFEFITQLQSTFCWNKTWHYDGSCRHLVDSPPAILEIDDSSMPLLVIPGNRLNLPLKIHNGNGRRVDDVNLRVCIKQGPAIFAGNKMCGVEKNGALLIYKHIEPVAINSVPMNDVGNIITLTVETIEFPPYQVDLIAKFANCSWPYSLINNTVCAVDASQFCCSGNPHCTDCNTDCNYANTNYIQEKVGHCISLAIDESYDIVDGQCPWFYYNHNCSSTKNVSPSCGETREGRLCGRCKEGFGVAMNSLYMECVSCKGWSGYKGWLILLAVEFVPLTIFILLVLVLKLDVSNGTVNGLILYCQLITLQLPGWYYPGWTAMFWAPDSPAAVLRQSTTDYKYLYVHASAVTPLSMWNLNFLPLIPVSPKDLPVCISESLSPLGAILFWYLIALYPVILLAIITLWVVLYLHKNYLFKVTRMIHKRLARFWLRFKITPSLFTSTATIYVLCFTQFAQTSLKLLNFNVYHSINGSDSVNRLAFNYDGTLNYFGWPWHFLAGLLALTILFVIVFLPMVWLLLYPFGWYQTILNHCRLNRQWLISLADVFTGQFKNGLDGTKDCRYFAGLFLLFRLPAIGIFFAPYRNPGPKLILALQIALTVYAAGTVMIIRPYKKNVHNLTNCFLLLYLAFLSGISYIPYKISVFRVLTALIYVPIILALSYAVYRVLQKIFIKLHAWCKAAQRSGATGSTPSSISTTDDFLPDRIVRRSNYNEHHVGVMPGDDDDDDHLHTAYDTSESSPIMSGNSNRSSQRQDVPLHMASSDHVMYGSIQ